ncbi:hypothetical protein [Allorhodopirellula heiligendammensis]|uniref:Uncharacterized protein n=1 Tax=Allorhodopirellula heiligendammensis TaxID=2714739 RepID=A0A5C6C1L6_9BACT|nr:hypothetical protein [Allorhodopirellula heiligendammensis]TWU18463.1 hypothetical protein Poly21_06260 [Allorhodopirellula heiligendammensis]
MSASNRTKLIAKLHSALKKHYSVPPASPSRPLLEHALYACLLEDCPSELADEGLAKLEQDYFDWNEVRVTTVTELSGVLSNLPDPAKAAGRLKSNLQAIFEEFYSFDLDHLKKENLGKAVAKFEKLPSMTPFVLSYIIQHGLGGHSIPIDYSAMVIMLVSGIASQNEASDGRVPGLERAIPKSKGVEFASLLHQPAVALLVDPADADARKLLETVSKGSSADLDEWLVSKKAAKKRVAKRKAEERETAKAEAEAEAAAEAIVAAPTGKKKPIRSAAKATSTTNKPKVKKKSSAEKTSEVAAKTKETKAEAAASTQKSTAAPKKKPAKKASTAKSDAESTAKKKTTGDSKTSSAKSDDKSGSSKKPTNRKLTKQKPR